MTMTGQSVAQFEFDSESKKLAESIAYADDQAKLWAKIAKDKKKQLMMLHDRGFIPTKFEHAGYKFARLSGKTSVQYDEITKMEIQRVKDQAVELGSASVTVGEPYWTITKIEK